MQMVLAPQLRQSLELLQVPILDLRAMLKEELEANPTLEERPSEEQSIEIEPPDSGEEENKELDLKEDIEALAQLNEEWREYFLQTESVRPYTSSDAEKRQFFLDSLPQKTSLQEHMMGQLAMSGLNEETRHIGELVIGSINDDGYLTSNVEELAVSAGVDPQHMADILDMIQKFDPVGVGARDLSECLLIQLERLGKEQGVAGRIVRDHLKALSRKQYQDIAHVLKTSLEEVQKAAKLIATLEPRPGRMYDTEALAYVLPEVVVRKIDGEYVVILNNEQIPHLRISQHYLALLNDANTTPEVKSYIRERIRSGVFLVKSIDQRQQTIYKIACEIVARQTEFLDHGIAHLKPLRMADVAKRVSVHETTVSRAIANKYMQTPLGLFEMKYFFTPGVKTDDGRELSNKTVKGMIADLIASEDPAKPYSDQDVQDLLKEKGIKVARRTITKYRLELNIFPSHLRKSV